MACDLCDLDSPVISIILRFSVAVGRYVVHHECKTPSQLCMVLLLHASDMCGTLLHCGLEIPMQCASSVSIHLLSLRSLKSASNNSGRTAFPRHYLRWQTSPAYLSLDNCMMQVYNVASTRDSCDNSINSPQAPPTSLPNVQAR